MELQNINEIFMFILSILIKVLYKFSQIIQNIEVISVINNKYRKIFDKYSINLFCLFIVNEHG